MDNIKSQTSGLLIIGIIDILLISLLPGLGVPDTAIVMSIGAVTFFGWLAWCIQISKTDSTKPNKKEILNKGEIRKGIAGSFMMVYFAMLALVVFGEPVERSPETPKIMDGFTQIIQIIIIFYFSSRTLEKWFEMNPPAGNNPAVTPPTEGGSGQQRSDQKQGPAGGSVPEGDISWALDNS